MKKGHDVTIIARHLPGDLDLYYTSPWAGANWMSFALKDEYRLQHYDAVSYPELMRLAREEPASGICIQTQDYWVHKDDNTVERELPWYKDLVEDFEILPKEELQDDGILFGYRFKTVVISTSIYLNFLLSKISNLGGVYKRVHINHIREANDYHHSVSNPDVIINCTGLLAGKLGGVEDKKVYPVRGQVLLLRNNSKRLFYRGGFKDYPSEAIYMMPRKEGGTIIGGCFLPHVYDGEPDEGLKKRTIERAIKYAPELVEGGKEIDIVRVQVGLRPYREGNIRLEKEYIIGVGKVVHNYGAGGAGYQSSYGAAEGVVKLVEEFDSNISRL